MPTVTIPMTGQQTTPTPTQTGWVDPSTLPASWTSVVAPTHDTRIGTIVQGYGPLEGFTKSGDFIIGGKTVPYSQIGWTGEKAKQQYDPWQVQGHDYFAKGPWMDPKYWNEDAKKMLYNGKAPDPNTEPVRFWAFINAVVPEYRKQTGSSIAVPTVESTKGYPWSPPPNFGLPSATSTTISSPPTVESTAPAPRQTAPMSFPQYGPTPIKAQPLAKAVPITPAAPISTPVTNSTALQPLPEIQTRNAAGFQPFALPSYGGVRSQTSLASPLGLASGNLAAPNLGGIRTMSKPSFNFPSYYNSPGPFYRTRKQQF